MKKNLVVLTVLVLLVPGAIANADDHIADLFVQYTYLDMKGSDDPAHTILLIGSREIRDWLSVWGSASEQTLTTLGDTTNTTGLGAGIGLHADFSERISSFVLVGYIRSIIDANYPGGDDASDDYMIQSRLSLSVNPVMDLSLGGDIFLGPGGTSEQWGGGLAFNVSDRLVMGYEMMLGEGTVAMTLTMQTPIGGNN
ncbi:MAG: hypothetical protein OXC69_01625 [Candidatus Tectomicrobia bacterium]|nr:hypothetical protein [Candidatus Tectomicrobia bacterium]